jgi:hypothetical protein
MHIRLAPGTTLTSVEGKDVLFSVKTGDSYGLNETAAGMLRVGCEADLDEVVINWRQSTASNATKFGAISKSSLANLFS